MAVDRDQRRRNDAKGRRAETIAALFLQMKGYRILARRVQTRVGEIDLVARKGDTLVFVEVKARATLDSGLFALHPAARRRIEAASRVLAPRYAGRCTTTRIDAVLVRPWALPVHMIAVWREQG
ncbi:MAG: YraN family protein [Sandarakinorhabdus sp.]|nr:YraN family protein [Sandarakinorhabdus sp.]